MYFIINGGSGGKDYKLTDYDCSQTDKARQLEIELRISPHAHKDTSKLVARHRLWGSYAHTLGNIITKKRPRTIREDYLRKYSHQQQNGGSIETRADGPLSTLLVQQKFMPSVHKAHIMRVKSAVASGEDKLIVKIFGKNLEFYHNSGFPVIGITHAVSNLKLKHARQEEVEMEACIPHGVELFTSRANRKVAIRTHFGYAESDEITDNAVESVKRYLHSSLSPIILEIAFLRAYLIETMGAASRVCMGDSVQCASSDAMPTTTDKKYKSNLQKYLIRLENEAIQENDGTEVQLLRGRNERNDLDPM
jgi:hypothetical protein